jgi:hypothetical protein
MPSRTAAGRQALGRQAWALRMALEPPVRPRPAPSRPTEALGTRPTGTPAVSDQNLRTPWRATVEENRPACHPAPLRAVERSRGRIRGARHPPKRKPEPLPPLRARRRTPGPRPRARPTRRRRAPADPRASSRLGARSLASQAQRPPQQYRAAQARLPRRLRWGMPRPAPPQPRAEAVSWEAQPWVYYRSTIRRARAGLPGMSSPARSPQELLGGLHHEYAIAA